MARRAGANAQKELKAMAAAHDAFAALDTAERIRALGWLCERLGLPVPSAGGGGGAVGGAYASLPPIDVSGSAAAVRQLLTTKRPGTAAEKILVLAYYLAHNAKQSAFRTRDLSRLNQEASLEKFTNATVAVNAAVKKGWFNNQGGQFSLTSVGERFASALPNRISVGEETRGRRGRRRG